MTLRGWTQVILATLLIAASRPAICQQGHPPTPVAENPVVVEALPSALDLASLEQMALAQNPTLVQAGAQVQLSRGKAIQAGLRPNPSIGYVAEQIGAAGTAGELHGMFIEQEIITGGKLQLSRSKFAQEARQAELQVFAQHCRVLYGVRVNFYETLVWQRRLQLRQRLLANAEEATVTVRELLNVGQANQSDALRAEVALQRARVTANMAERHLQGSWDELSAVVGAPDMVRTALDDTMDFASHESVDRLAALENVLNRSPELQFARAEVARDQIGLRRERAEPIPNIDLRAETGYNFEAQDTVAGVEIGFHLPLFDKNQGTILQAQAELTRAQAEVDRVALMLRKRFAHTFAEYETSRQSAEAYRDNILPKAEEIYQSNLNSFHERRAAWPQVVDAQREYFELYEAYLDDLRAARRAEAQIAFFFLEDGLQQPPEPTPQGHRDAAPKPR
jgi:cobalt-zinc-cadmium efflux system outer membrane protein